MGSGGVYSEQQPLYCWGVNTNTLSYFYVKCKQARSVGRGIPFFLFLQKFCNRFQSLRYCKVLPGICVSTPVFQHWHDLKDSIQPSVVLIAPEVGLEAPVDIYSSVDV